MPTKLVSGPGTRIGRRLCLKLPSACLLLFRKMIVTMWQLKVSETLNKIHAHGKSSAPIPHCFSEMFTSKCVGILYDFKET